MPKHNTDQYIRGQVLDAYRAIDDPVLELREEEEGSVLRRTQSAIYNIGIRQKQQLQQEIEAYFRIGQLWKDETAHIVNPRERKTVLRSLSQIIPKRDAMAATRIYQLFQYRPGAINRLQSVTKNQIAEMTCEAFEELEIEVQQFQQDFQELELFLDV
jgi:hypothetical protein